MENFKLRNSASISSNHSFLYQDSSFSFDDESGEFKALCSIHL